MQPSRVGSPQGTEAESPNSPVTASVDRDSSGGLNGGSAETRNVRSGGIKPRTLIAYAKYFGLEARVFHSGAKRMLERIGANGPNPPGQACINARTIAHDFCLDAPASGTLLRAFLADRLLYPDGAGHYEATNRFREYALADMAVPLSRVQARDLIERVCGVAARINAEWPRSPFLIDTIAVSGSYMSGADLLPELPLWLVLRFRRQPATRNPIRWQSKEEALVHIKAAIKALSSLVVVHIVSDKEKVQRPFSVVFQEGVTPPASALGGLRDGGVPLSRRPVATPLGTVPAHSVPAGSAGSQPDRLVQRDKSVWIDVSKRG